VRETVRELLTHSDYDPVHQSTISVSVSEQSTARGLSGRLGNVGDGGERS
jgi:hypothetical protein